MKIREFVQRKIASRRESLPSGAASGLFGILLLWFGKQPCGWRRFLGIRGRTMARNQMFSQMNQAALTRLKGRSPGEIARNAGIRYEEETQAFHIPTMGMDVTVHYPDYRFAPELPGWHRLVILHYLDLADGFPLTGKEISFGQMKSGMVRGGIDRRCELALQDLKCLNEDSLAKICGHIGGVRIPTNADASWRIPFLPNFPVTLKIWLPDEEFPASGRLLLDSSADHYLTIEDAVTVAEIILERIITMK